MHNTSTSSQRENSLGEISTQSHKRTASLDNVVFLSSDVKRQVTGNHKLLASMDNIQTQMEKNKVFQKRRQQMVVNTQEKSQQLLTSKAIQVLKRDYDRK